MKNEMNDENDLKKQNNINKNTTNNNGPNVNQQNLRKKITILHYLEN